MNEEALKYSYDLFSKDGYNGSLDDYKELVKTDKEALGYSYNLFSKDGYNGSIDEFKELIIINKTDKSQIKSQEEEESQQETIVEEIEKPSEEIVEGVDEETSKGIEKYKNRLTNIMNSVPSEKELEAYANNAKKGGYIDFLKVARKNLEAKGVQINNENLFAEAEKLSINAQQEELKQEQYNQELENFETEFGVDRTEDLGSFIETVTQFSPIGPLKKAITGIRDVWDLGEKYMAGEEILTKEEQEQYDKDFWGFLVNQKDRYAGTEQQKDYERNRQELYRQLRTDEYELEKEYRDKVSDLTAVGDGIQVSINRLGDFEKRIQEKDPNFTQKDYEEYTALFDEVKIAKEEFDKDIENLGTIPSDNFETIKNLTLKTYDNLDMVNNNINSSLVGVVGGLTALQKELNLPLAILKWSGYDLTKEEDLSKVFGEGDSILKSGAKVVGGINEKGDEMIDGVFNLSQAIKGQNAPTIQSIGDIKSPEDFGMYALDMLSSQVVNTGMTIAFPPVGLSTLR